MLSRLLKTNQHAAHSILLVLLVLFVFVLPVFPENWHRLIYLISFSFIFIYCILALDKGRERALPLALVNFALLIIAYIFHILILDIVSKLAMIIFFGIIAFRLIMQIAAIKKVNLVVIVNSISGYLLMGVLFALILTIILMIYPDSLTLKTGAESPVPELVYFSFVTMTTLGYGDIVPTLPVTRSMAVFIGVSGQFYIAIIVAMLVSKYISRSQSS